MTVSVKGHLSGQTSDAKAIHSCSTGLENAETQKYCLANLLKAGGYIS